MERGKGLGARRLGEGGRDKGVGQGGWGKGVGQGVGARGWNLYLNEVLNKTGIVSRF